MYRFAREECCIQLATGWERVWKLHTSSSDQTVSYTPGLAVVEFIMSSRPISCGIRRKPSRGFPPRLYSKTLSVDNCHRLHF